jgi:hypothetical protein
VDVGYSPQVGPAQYACRVRCSVGERLCEVLFTLMDEDHASTRYAVGVVDHDSRELIAPRGMLTVPAGPPAPHASRIQFERLLGFFTGWLDAPVELLVDR